jgi:CIC family chloride channel protein
MTHSYFTTIRFFVLIILVGVVAGLGAIVFRELIGLFHNFFFYGQFSAAYDVLQHAVPSRFGVGIILVPVIGALLVAYLVQNFAPEAKGHGVPEVMDAIYYERGIVRPIVAVVKAIASSISIGSGGSIGREGPIIQIGAAFGSALGQWVKIADWQRIVLIACGAGGGIAATFNTPFGGILFAAEIMLPELSARTLIPVSIAIAIATYTSYFYFGNLAFIPFATNAVLEWHGFEMISLILLSIVVGMFSAIFIHTIYFTEDMFDRIPGNYYLRHALGMFFVGINMYLMMYFFGHYYIQGVGYATVVDVLGSTLTHPGFLFFLAVLKLIDTSVTLGSGGSGGIFSPLLFIGATLGAAFAGICGINMPLGALAGMAGMVGASTAAPLTAIIMTAELTQDFTIILPLMIIVMIAYAVRRALIKDSVYTLKLTRRGHPIPYALQSKPQVMVK